MMLLRNRDPPKLCNGTRLTIKKMTPTVDNSEAVFIPKIPLIPSDIPFQFKRLKFPVKLNFEICINKAQGQSLDVVGLKLTEPVFSLGQHYVRCSRVGNPNYYFFKLYLTRKGQKCLSRDCVNLIRNTQASGVYCNICQRCKYFVNLCYL